MAEVGGVAGDRLRTIIERIERLEDEKKALSEMKKAEALIIQSSDLGVKNAFSK